MNIVCLCIDRIDKADDNAEFFYRWLRKNKPNITIYFGLQKTAADWSRLEADGFNLIDLNKAYQQRDILKTVTHLLVSNPAAKNKYIAPNAIRIFLQHGITNRRAKASADYLNLCAAWADFILATSEAEKTLLTSSPYRIKSEQVCVTGFPRHDALCKKNKEATKQYICIQPHWGMYLNSYEEFLASEYFNGWKKLLQSEELKKYIEESGITVAFRLHPCSYKYEKDWLDILPPYIKYIDKSESFQKTFTESLLYVSDYSSNMFEVGIIDTPCLYYRPDAEFVKNKTDAGDFEQNILGVIGPSTYTVDQFIDTLYEYTKNNFSIPTEYIATRSQLFPYKYDTQNCERVFNQVILGTTNYVPKYIKLKQAQTRNASGSIQTAYLYF